MNREIAYNLKKIADKFTLNKMKTRQSENIFRNTNVQHPYRAQRRDSTHQNEQEIMKPS